MEENTNKHKTLRTELVGGPLCGSTVDWPEDVPTLVYGKYHARYEFEGTTNGRNTAFYKGYAEE